MAAPVSAAPPMAYAAPPAGPPAGWTQHPPPGELSALAVIALVLGLLWPFGAIPAIIVGWIALNRIQSRNQSGRGLAIAGIVLGGIAVLLGVIAAVIVFVLGASGGVVDKDNGTGTTSGRATTSCMTEYRTLRTATEAYAAQNGGYPSSMTDLYDANFLRAGSQDDLRFRLVPGEGTSAPTFEALPGECEGTGD